MVEESPPVDRKVSPLMVSLGGDIMRGERKNTDKNKEKSEIGGNARVTKAVCCFLVLQSDISLNM